MSHNTKLHRFILASVAVATMVAGGAVLPQTANASPDSGTATQDSGRYQHEAAHPTPFVTTDSDAMSVQAAPTAVTREEMMARAKRWVELGMDYDNFSAFEGYRKDCSGFVSMAWKLNANPTTRYLDDHSHNISKDELLPGDALLWVNPNPSEYGHVRLFGGWLDAGRTRFWVYEQTPPRARYSEFTWANSVANGYRPIRADNVIEADPSGAAFHAMRRADGSWTQFGGLGMDAKDVAVASMPDGSAQVVAVGADDVVYHRVRNAAGSWTAFVPLNGFGAPAKGKRVDIAAAADGSAQVVITGMDSVVYHSVRRADGTWTQFGGLGTTAKDVAIAVTPDGVGHTVVVGPDDVVSHRVRNTNGSWTAFVPLNGFGAPAEGKQVDIAAAPDGSAQVVITGMDGVVYHSIRQASGTWTQFGGLGTTAKDVAIAVTPDGVGHTVVVGPNDVVSHRVRNTNGSWTAFVPLNGFGGPAMGKTVSIAGGADNTAQVTLTGI